MSNIASQLLQKVKESIKLRQTDVDSYNSYYKNPSSFITATIGGKQEFIPISLICKNYDTYQTLLELFQVFGNPAINIELNERLKTFYDGHDLEWKSDANRVEIKYYVKPAPKNESSSFFKSSIIDKLSSYAGTHYKASDAFLKDLGNTYADEIVDKTNDWADSIDLPAGYVIEHERYWQVAGRFKSFTWAKVYKEEHKDKKIFFSVGVDVQNRNLMIKLDVLRSGTHKLSNFEIRDFDYFTNEIELAISYNLDTIDKLNLDELSFITNQFIANTKDTYELAIDFIWNNQVDNSLYSNKLFKLTTAYSSDKPDSADNIIQKDLEGLIIEYEKYMLTHSGRGELVDNITTDLEGSLHVIKSFETDGKQKTILYKVSTGGTQSPLEMSREEIEYLGDNLHTFLYHIVEYDINQHSGKLLIRKGSPTKYAELKSTVYEVKIG